MVRKTKKLVKKNNKFNKKFLRKTCGKKQKITQTIYKKYTKQKNKNKKQYFYRGGSIKNYHGSTGNYMIMMVGDSETQKQLSLNSAFN